MAINNQNDETLSELEKNLGEGFLGNVVVVGGNSNLISDDSKDLR